MRSIAASISPGATMSSASSSGCSSRSERIAWRARRSPTKRGSRRFAAPGMIPSLRAGSVQRQPCLGEDVVDGQQQLAAAADRERLRRRDPQLLRLRLAEAAVDLVHEAEVADREEQVGDLAAVEVGEVQPGAEDAPPGVARVLDDAAAQHRDLDLRVERSARSMPASNGPVVVSSSALRWRGLRSSTVPTLPVARDRRGAEVDVAGALELVLVVERELRRAQHHVDQVAAGVRVGQHVAEQLALRDLVALLVLLEALALALDLRAARRRGRGRARRRRRRGRRRAGRRGRRRSAAA